METTLTTSPSTNPRRRRNHHRKPATQTPATGQDKGRRNPQASRDTKGRNPKGQGKNQKRRDDVVTGEPVAKLHSQAAVAVRVASGAQHWIGRFDGYDELLDREVGPEYGFFKESAEWVKLFADADPAEITFTRREAGKAKAAIDYVFEFSRMLKGEPAKKDTKNTKEKVATAA